VVVVDVTAGVVAGVALDSVFEAAGVVDVGVVDLSAPRLSVL
jgi:hypothetical protein